MPDPTFLGISKATWDLYNGFANWAAAAGSFAAAATALWIASDSKRVKARIAVKNVMVAAPGTSSTVDCIAFTIVNT